jgi:tetratricopeptide (TPR) repeat protein
MTNRTQAALLVAVGVLLVAGVVVAIRRPWDSPEHLSQLAEQALRESRYSEAQHYAARLEAEGRRDQSRLIRGQIWLAEGRQLWDQHRMVGEREQAQRLAGLVLAAGRLLSGLPAPPEFAAAQTHDPLLWPPLGSLGPWGAQRRALRERADAAFLQAVRELAEIPPGPLHDAATLALAEGITHLRDLGRRPPLDLVTGRLQQLVERQPDHLEARRRLAQIYIDLNALALAQRELQEVARLDPSDGRPWRFLALIHRDTLREGLAILAYEEALRRQLQPHVAAEVREELAQLLLDQGFPQRAVEVLEAAPAWVRHSPTGRTIEAAARWNLNQKPQARQLVELALRDDPGLVAALRLAGKMYLDEDRPQQAVELLLRAVQRDPHDEKSRHLLADACRAAGDATAAAFHQQRFEETVAYLQEIGRLGKIAHQEPWNAEVRVQIARLWFTLGRPRQAATWARSALAADPGSAEARALLRNLEEAPE